MIIIWKLYLNGVPIPTPFFMLEVHSFSMMVSLEVACSYTHHKSI